MAVERKTHSQANPFQSVGRKRSNSLRRRMASMSGSLPKADTPSATRPRDWYKAKHCASGALQVWQSGGSQVWVSWLWIFAGAVGFTIQRSGDYDAQGFGGAGPRRFGQSGMRRSDDSEIRSFRDLECLCLGSGVWQLWIIWDLEFQRLRDSLVRVCEDSETPRLGDLEMQRLAHEEIR